MLTRTSVPYIRNNRTHARHPPGPLLALCIGLAWLLNGTWAPATRFYNSTQTNFSLNGRARLEAPSYSANGPASSANTNPALAYSTYLGGKDYDSISAIAVDDLGFVYLTGTTKSTDFPLANPLQAKPGEGWDAFVAKLSPDGSRLIFSTYLGGNGDDFGNDIALDGEGNIYVAGQTQSTDFPVTTNAIQKSNHGDIDAFVVKLNPQGGTILYSTYLGGRDGDGATGIALGTNGDIYLVGGTTSTDFPTANPLQSKEAGPPSDKLVKLTGIEGDLFIAKLKADGSSLLYSTYLGGSGEDYSAGIAVDKDGNAYLAGSTRSKDFPTSNPLQAHPRGFQNMFVAKLNPAGSALVYSTYLGGSGDESGGSIAVDEDGNAYIGGSSGSRDFPTANAFQDTNRGTGNLFVTKLNPAGSALVFSTYLGGIDDNGGGIALDSQHNVYVVGDASSGSFPTLHAIQSKSGGQTDATLTKLDAQGNALYYSTFLGGSDNDTGTALAVDKGGNAYLAGITFSKDFPTSKPLQPSLARAQDAFLAKIPAPDSGLTPTSQFTYWWSGPLDAMLIIASIIALMIAGILFSRRRWAREPVSAPARGPAYAATLRLPEPPMLGTRPEDPSSPLTGHIQVDATAAEDIEPPGRFVPPPPPTPQAGAGEVPLPLPPPPPPPVPTPVSPQLGVGATPIPPPPPLSVLQGASAGVAPIDVERAELVVLRKWPLWTLWPLWVGANAAGGVLGALASMAFNQWQLDGSPGGIGSTVALTTYLTAAIILLVLAPFQWLALKLYVPRMPWESAIWWSTASSVAGSVAVMVGMFALFPILILSMAGLPGQAASGVWSGLIPGAIIGLAQWLVLRGHLRRAGWWVGVNALAWGLGMGISGAIFGTLGVASAIVGLVGNPIPLGSLITIASAVSGLGLLWILKMEAAPYGDRRRTGFGVPAALAGLAALMLVMCASPLFYLFTNNPLDSLMGGSLLSQMSVGGPFGPDVARSADGKLLAMANDTDKIRVVSATNYQGVANLSSYNGTVQNVWWSPDGQYLAMLVGAKSDSIQVWAKSNWQLVFTASPGPAPSNDPDTYNEPTEITWSPDSRRVAVGVTTSTTKGNDYLDKIGTQGQIEIFDVPSGHNSATLDYPSPAGIWSLAWSPDGRHIAFVTQKAGSTYEQSALLLWDVQGRGGIATAANTVTLASLSGELGGLTWSPDGKLLAVGGGDDTVRVVDAASGQTAKTLDTGGRASTIAWSPDGKYISASIDDVAGVFDSSVMIWDYTSGTQITALQHLTMASGFPWAMDSSQLTVVGQGTSVKVLSMADLLKAQAQSSPTPQSALVQAGPNMIEFTGHTDNVNCVAWSPDGKLLASGGDDKRVLVWDAATGRTVAVLRFSAEVYAIAWSPDGKYLAIGSGEYGQQLVVWDTANWQQIHTFGVAARLTGLAWSPDSKSIAASSWHGLGEKYAWATVWDVESGKQVYDLPHTSGVSAVAWSPDGKQIATGASESDILSDNTVLVWDLHPSQSISPTVVATFQHDDYVTAVAWSPDGAVLASASQDKTVRLWDPHKQQALGTLDQPGIVHNISWAPDGNRLASLTGDSVGIWDVTSKRMTDSQKSTATGGGLAWSADGKELAFGGTDHSVIVWEINEK